MKLYISISGLSMMATVLTLLILSLFLAVLVSIITTGGLTGAAEEMGIQALYIAAGGAEWGMMELNSGAPPGMTKCKTMEGWSAAERTKTFGPASGDEFTITVKEWKSAPPTQLSGGGIDSTQTTIPVDSASGYAPSGRITIDNEKIDYASISGNSFTGCIRGVDGSTAVAHNVPPNKPVFQNQCDIESEGRVPSPSFFGSIKRKVKVSATP
jgi:hypothetical protein